MSIVTIANEAEALQKIWNNLTGCSIAWEVENKNLPSCSMAYARQGSGTRHGTWDDIPNGEVEECGTQHDGIFGAGNNGGVMYKLLDGVYFAIMWSDPSVGTSYYYPYWGSKAAVLPVVQKWSNTFFTNSTPISGGESKSYYIGGATVKIQPGFDPFGLTFISGAVDDSSEELQAEPKVLELDDDNKSDSSRIRAIEEALTRYESIGKVFRDKL